MDNLNDNLTNLGYIRNFTNPARWMHEDSTFPSLYIEDGMIYASIEDLTMCNIQGTFTWDEFYNKLKPLLRIDKINNLKNIIKNDK